MDVSGANNFSRLIVKMPWNSGGICQIHASNMSLYPPITYAHAPYHGVDVGAVKTMLFIGTHFDVTHWRNLIQSCRSCL